MWIKVLSSISSPVGKGTPLATTEEEGMLLVCAEASSEDDFVCVKDVGRGEEELLLLFPLPLLLLLFVFPSDPGT